MRVKFVPAFLIAAFPAVAQAQPATPADPPKVMSIVAEVAPQWATPNPWDYDQITDSTSVSLKLTAKPVVSKLFEVELAAGPKATLDDDNDSSRDSAFGLGGTIRIPATLGFKLFGSAAYEKKYTEFFRDSNGNQRTYSTGLEFGYDIPRSSADKKVPRLAASAAVGAVDASDDSTDQSFAQVKAGFGIPLWWFGKFDIEANGARRWFEHTHAIAGIKERRTEWGTSLGFDFARGVILLTGGDPKNNPWLRKFKVGYNYFERNSNVAGADKTSSSPSLALAVGQDF